MANRLHFLRASAAPPAIGKPEQRSPEELSLPGRQRTGRIGVLFVNTAEFFGPVMQVHSQLMKHLNHEAYRVFVVTNRRGDSSAKLRRLEDIVVEELDFGPPIGRRGLAGKLRPALAALRTGASLLKTVRLVRKEDIQIIHSGSQTKALLLSTLVSGLTGRKLVVHVHEHHHVKQAWKRALITFGLRRAHAVVTVSRAMIASVRSFGVEPGRVWPVLNVVDLERFRPDGDRNEARRDYGIVPRAPLIVVAGRIMAQKGQLDLLKAMLIVRQRRPDATALILGWNSPLKMADGRTYRQQLEAFCEENDLFTHVMFAPARPDVEKVYAAADILVVPSVYEEPFGLVVVEAMAMGKPVVATRTGGIPEIIEDGKTGLLVPPHSPGDLAARILWLVESPLLRRRLGREARRAAEQRFYEARLAEEVAEVYRRILA